MPLPKKDCPFCAPLVFDACFAETRNFRAIYNIAPVLPGHCMIIPKKHTLSYLDLPEELMTEMVSFSRKVVRTLMKAFNQTAFDWTIQEGLAAGQTIDHLHIHIIPRKSGDLPEPGDWYPRLLKNNDELIDSHIRSKYSREELKNISRHLNVVYNKLDEVI